MTAGLLWVGTALVAGAATHRAAVMMARSVPLSGPNYRGVQVPGPLGIAPIVGFLLGLGVLGIVRAIAADAPTPAAAAAVGVPMAAAAAGFGLLGLWDDLAATPGRGWRAHVGALVRARPTPGALRLAGGGALAVAVVAPLGEGLGWTLASGAVVALTANLFNLLDVRPGRAGKAYLLAAVPLLAIGGAPAPALAAGAGAVAAFLPLDLRERAMLGNTGAYGLGATIGVATVAHASHTWRLAILAVLLVLHVLADRPSLSRGIERISPLRALDRAGRVPEDDAGSAVRPLLR